MSKGYLQVNLTSYAGGAPVTNATVLIEQILNQKIVGSAVVHPDENGICPQTNIETPPMQDSLDPNFEGIPYALVNVSVTSPDYQESFVYGVQVFAQRISIQLVELYPYGQRTNASNIHIPQNALLLPQQATLEIPDIEEVLQPEANGIEPQVLRNVVVPEYITVHLGTPNSASRNVTVLFSDYIKNVCSSEIYPTWPNETIKANIIAETSIILNRIWTEWYRSRGYAFDITSSTAYDQYFVYGRNIYKNISDLVDEVFAIYIRRIGTVNPIFATYCDGKNVTCTGMSQWGSEALGVRGYNAITILKNYYGSDIEYAEAVAISGTPSSYPGYVLRRGASGDNITKMQNELNRIGQNYPAIPQTPVTGVFDAATEKAVRAFQKVFGLVQDGLVGPNTWYKISYIYTAVKRLAELGAEGEYPNGEQYPGTPLKLGSRGQSVRKIQTWLREIAENKYASIPVINVDGVFGTATQNAVKIFQQGFGLTTDGIVGPTTWNKIRQVHDTI